VVSCGWKCLLKIFQLCKISKGFTIYIFAFSSWPDCNNLVESSWSPLFYLRCKQTRRTAQLKFYRTMTGSFLLNGSERWMSRRKYEHSIETADMKMKGSTRHDHIRNGKVRNEPEVKPVIIQILQYREKWEQLRRMEKHRCVRITWKCQPAGRSNLRRARMRWNIELEQAIGFRPWRRRRGGKRLYYYLRYHK
jgi:hypothetical protein